MSKTSSSLCSTSCRVVVLHHQKCFLQNSNSEKSLILFKLTFHLVSCCKLPVYQQSEDVIKRDWMQRESNFMALPHLWIFLPESLRDFHLTWRLLSKEINKPHGPTLDNDIIKLCLCFQCLDRETFSGRRCVWVFFKTHKSAKLMTLNEKLIFDLWMFLMLLKVYKHQ